VPLILLTTFLIAVPTAKKPLLLNSHQEIGSKKKLHHIRPACYMFLIPTWEKSLKIKIEEREEIKSWSVKLDTSQALVVPAYNPSYLEDYELED
jgi:hypothetical protein